MPRGQEFSKDFKQLAFSIIEFVENEKSGCSIPLYNVNERLQTMLHISDRSITRLKKEMRQLKIEEENAIRSRLPHHHHQQSVFQLRHLLQSNILLVDLKYN